MYHQFMEDLDKKFYGKKGMAGDYLPVGKDWIATVSGGNKNDWKGECKYKMG